MSALSELEDALAIASHDLKSQVGKTVIASLAADGVLEPSEASLDCFARQLTDDFAMHEARFDTALTAFGQLLRPLEVEP